MSSPARARTLRPGRVLLAVAVTGLAAGSVFFARAGALAMFDQDVVAGGITCGSVWHSWSPLVPHDPRPMVDPLAAKAVWDRCAAAAAPRAHQGVRDLALAGGLAVVPGAWLVTCLVRHRRVLVTRLQS